MDDRQPLRHGVRLALSVLLLCGGIGGVSAVQAGVDPFDALMLPGTSNQEVDSSFDLTFEVDATARHFNGYEIQVAWDPDVLSLESVQEGSLMTDACPNNFTNLVFTDSTATYSHVLLCGGVSLDGPGVLSTWRFHANAPGTTVVDLVSNPDRTFFDDGIFITPAHPTDPRQVYLFDATVTVGTSAGIGDGDPPLVDGVHVRVIPNPVRDRAALHLQAPSSAAPGPVAIEIVDTGGRRVAGWTWDSIPSTEIRVAWDATDRSGRPLPAGAYFYVARVDGQTARGKIQIVR